MTGALRAMSPATATATTTATLTDANVDNTSGAFGRGDTPRRQVFLLLSLARSLSGSCCGSQADTRLRVRSSRFPPVTDDEDAPWRPRRRWRRRRRPSPPRGLFYGGERARASHRGELFSRLQSAGEERRGEKRERPCQANGRTRGRKWWGRQQAWGWRGGTSCRARQKRGRGGGEEEARGGGGGYAREQKGPRAQGRGGPPSPPFTQRLWRLLLRLSRERDPTSAATRRSDGHSQYIDPA